MKNKYIQYKMDFPNYIVFIKSGNFYVCLNDDALIMNRIFQYKLIENSNFIKIGFPLSSLNKNLDILYKKCINYIVVENDTIIIKEKFEDNCYKHYMNFENYSFYMNRIHKINEILQNNLSNPNIKNILDEIEEKLCKINY